jgi:hypothetical protein
MRLYSSWAIKYRIMVSVELTCRLFKDIEKNAREFTVVVHATDYIDTLKEKIYEEVKKSNNDFFDIETEELMLWKVEINNKNDEEFSNLVLNDDKTKNVTVTKLRGKVEDFWDDEERRPKKGYTHIIINSPRLIERRKKDEQIRGLVQTDQNNQDLIGHEDNKLFTRLSDMLIAVNERPRLYGKFPAFLRWLAKEVSM